MKTINKLVVSSVFLPLVLILVLFTPVISNAQYNNCTYHAYRLCVGNSIYWYSGICNQQQDFIQDCSASGQTCQYGQCVTYVQPVQPTNDYNAYFQTACSAGSVYWYDSLGVRSGLFKSCNDNNSCTQDSCANSKCLNINKCDGSACAVGSVDYNVHCSSEGVNNQNQCGNGLCEIGLGETDVSCPTDCKTNITNGLSTTFFAKQSSSNQWQKTVQANSNGRIYFMISVVNTSTVQIDNVNISIEKPEEISSIENLQLDGTQFSGDIVSGINVGSIIASSIKLITFEGKTRAISSTSLQQLTAKSSASGNTQSDSIHVNFNVASVDTTVDAAAAASQAPATSGFMEFLKRWYMWILAFLVLISLFMIVFKRFSSEA